VLYNQKRVTAKRPYACSECDYPIFRGEVYEYVFGRWERYVGEFKTCLACVTARKAKEALSGCDCSAHGGLQSELWDQFYHLSSGSGRKFALGRLWVQMERRKRLARRLRREKANV
jgi:hypothetical protein